MENTVLLPLALDSPGTPADSLQRQCSQKTKVTHPAKSWVQAFKVPERRWIEIENINKGQKTDEETSLQAYAAAAVT